MGIRVYTSTLHESSSPNICLQRAPSQRNFHWKANTSNPTKDSERNGLRKVHIAKEFRLRSTFPHQCTVRQHNTRMKAVRAGRDKCAQLEWSKHYEHLTPLKLWEPAWLHKNGSLTLERLLTISERLMVASDRLQTDLTSIRDIDQVPHCTFCLGGANMTFECLHASSTETAIRLRPCNFHNPENGWTANRWLTRSTTTKQGRHPLYHCLPTFKSGSRENCGTPSTGQIDIRLFLRCGLGVRSRPLLGCSIRAHRYHTALASRN